MCSHVGDYERMRAHKALGVHLGSSHIVVDIGCNDDVNKSWCSLMFVECRLTVERHDTPGVLPGDSQIEVDTCCLGDVMSPDVLLFWHNTYS